MIGAWSNQFMNGGAPGPSAPFSAVQADGWKATVTSPSDLSLLPATVTRAGFDSTGGATTISDTVYLAKRIRLPFPNQATLTTNDQALSDYIYAADSIAGATNSSTEVSPKPVANWVVTDRKIVGNSLVVEITAFHRNGIACVEFRATDGTTTVTAVTTTPVVSGLSTDRNAVIVYRATLDLTTLADNSNITVNAKVFPRFGVSASVLDSAAQSNGWEFSPRVWRKNISRAASPPIVYVASGGNDTTGYVGTDDALAAASPCLTLTGAINRARTVLGTGSGSLDGLRVRLTAGTWSRSASPTSNTVNSAIIIEPGTGVAKADAIHEFGAANNTFGATYICLSGITVRRQGAFYPFNSATGHHVTENCDWDFNGQTGALAGSATLFFWNGVTMTGQGSSVLAAGSPIHGMFRGCSFGSANSTATIEPNLIVGSVVTGCRTSAGSRNISNGIIAFNRWLQAGSSSGPVVAINQTPDINGYAVVQNVIEYTSATSNPALAISHDSQSANTSHIIVWHNTIAGFYLNGRGNLLYNDTAAFARTHKLASFIGNIHVQLNTKHDVFMSDGTRVQGWPYMFAVGVRNEFSRYIDANNGGLGGSFAQAYGGIGSSIGTASTGAGQDPLFTDYKATTTAGAAGAGNGTYTLGGASPARAFVPDSPIPFDLTGAARSGTVAAGAYI